MREGEGREHERGKGERDNMRGGREREHERGKGENMRGGRERETT